MRLHFAYARPRTGRGKSRDGARCRHPRARIPPSCVRPHQSCVSGPGARPDGLRLARPLCRTHCRAYWRGEPNLALSVVPFVHPRPRLIRQRCCGASVAASPGLRRRTRPDGVWNGRRLSVAPAFRRIRVRALLQRPKALKRPSQRAQTATANRDPAGDLVLHAQGRGTVTARSVWSSVRRRPS